ncbi:hypothetical protein GQ457_04G036740 [Hibiscus cannabinus]
MLSTLSFFPSKLGVAVTPRHTPPLSSLESPAHFAQPPIVGSRGRRVNQTSNDWIFFVFDIHRRIDAPPVGYRRRVVGRNGRRTPATTVVKSNEATSGGNVVNFEIENAAVDWTSRGKALFRCGPRERETMGDKLHRRERNSPDHQLRPLNDRRSALAPKINGAKRHTYNMTTGENEPTLRPQLYMDLPLISAYIGDRLVNLHSVDDWLSI